jgi:hypothetical protein
MFWSNIFRYERVHTYNFRGEALIPTLHRQKSMVYLLISAVGIVELDANVPSVAEAVAVPLSSVVATISTSTETGRERDTSQSDLFSCPILTEKERWILYFDPYRPLFLISHMEAGYGASTDTCHYTSDSEVLGGGEDPQGSKENPAQSTPTLEIGEKWPPPSQGDSANGGPASSVEQGDTTQEIERNPGNAVGNVSGLNTIIGEHHYIMMLVQLVNLSLLAIRIRFEMSSSVFHSSIMNVNNTNIH